MSINDLFDGSDAHLLNNNQDGFEEMIEFELPFPPSINHYWKHRVVGKRPMIYLSTKGAEFKSEVARHFRCHPVVKLNGRLSVSIKLHAPTNRSYDIDNRVKSLLDALTSAGVWHDDEQVDELHVSRGEKIKGGCVKVLITQMGGL